MQSKTRKDVFYLNQGTLSRIPLPHDNKINSITLEDEFLSFYKPGAKELIIRYHIINIEGLSIYKEKRSPRHLSWLISPRFIMLNDHQVEQYIKKDHSLVYLYHYIGDNTIIIELFSNAEHTRIWLEAYADHIEYEWIL